MWSVRALRFIMISICLLTYLSAGSLSVSLSPSNPSEGQAVSYQATLTGAKTNPKIIAIPKCNGWEGINWSNPSTSRSMSFDSRTGQKVSLTFTWQGKAKTKGTYPVTPLILEVDGQRLTSKNLTLNVTPLQTSNFYLFQTSLSTPEAFIGQSVDLHLDLLISDAQVQQYERYMGQNYELANSHYDAMKLEGTWTDNFHIVPKQVRQAQGSNMYYGVNTNKVKLGEFFYRRHRLTFTLEPKQAGTFNIPALQQKFYQLTFKRGFIGIDAQRQPRPIIAKSKPLTLKVGGPPSKDQPISFNGQVCENLRVELLVPDLTPGQQVQMHAPIPLQLKISGSLAPTSIRSPKWTAQKELSEGYDISAQSMIREDKDKHTLFSEVVIRPKSAKLSAIPPIEITYFNPTSKTYQTTKTKPFPLTVQAVDEGAGLEEQPLALLELKKERSKTKTIGRIEGIEINYDRLIESSQKNWNWFAIISLTYLPLLITALYYSTNKLKSRQQQKSHADRYRAVGTIKTIEGSDSTSAILEAVNRFINNKWNVTDPRKANMNEASKTHLNQLLANLEAASYAPDGGDQSSLKKQAVDLVKQLDKEGK